MPETLSEPPPSPDRREALRRLRARMAELGLGALVIPTSDEHLNEYVPEHRRRLRALTGFTGSAGDGLVTADEAWLFVDGRYHLQAEQECDGELFQIEKLGAGGRSLTTRLRELRESQPEQPVGVDPAVIPARRFASLARAAGGALVGTSGSLVDEVLPAQAPTRGAIEAVPAEVLGTTLAERLDAARALLAELEVAATVVTALDQIAWLLGLRGADIPFNPVFEATLLLSAERCIVLVPEAHLAAVSERCAAEPVTVRSGSLDAALTELLESASESASTGGGRWLLDDDRSPQALHDRLRALGREIRHGVDVLELLKSRKSPAEAAAMRRAGIEAGVAKVKAWRRLDRALAAGRAVSERELAGWLEAEYAARPGFRGLSFSTIGSFGANAAINHYATPSEAVVAAPGDWILVDSGAHYVGGTTDATRTRVVGPPSEDQRFHYTAVLEALLEGSGLIFPAGTCGAQVDAVTRAPLWRRGLDFLHGTGHGVGAWLNVHEGPIGIGSLARGRMSRRPLESGQVVSIEPGWYRSGVGGVRLENLYLIESTGEDELGRSRLAFSPLTFLPFERELIDREALAPRQLARLDAYHRLVRETLGRHLSEDERAWLDERCAPLA